MPPVPAAVLVALTGVLFAPPLLAAEPVELEHDADLEVALLLADPTIAQPIEVTQDERGRLWVVEYRQYPDPAGLTELERDEYWRVRWDRELPPPPYEEGSPFRGRDRISVHSDADGDGTYETHQTFLEGLNLTTSVAFDAGRGGGGVWVLSPPQLLFYPDADGDLVPDGPPEVHLTGFGLEDSHSIANSLTWGPDGWLYGGNGSTCTIAVTAPLATPDAAPVKRSGQLVWRYRPDVGFEVFAEGGGNTFGLEIDAAGNVFSGHNGGDTRGFHFVDGGYYRKNFGKHGDLSNPLALGFFEAIPHPPVARFTHHFVRYDADALPQRFHGNLVALDVLHNNLALTEMRPNGSTFATEDLSRPVRGGEDFRPVDLDLAYDGTLLMADWADAVVSHYRNHEGEIEPSTGRIYRVQPKGWTPAPPPDFSTGQLVERLKSPNRAVRRTAVRLIRQRGATELLDDLEPLMHGPAPVAFDAYAAARSVADPARRQALDRAALIHPDPSLRRLAVGMIEEALSSPLPSGRGAGGEGAAQPSEQGPNEGERRTSDRQDARAAPRTPSPPTPLPQGGEGGSVSRLLAELAASEADPGVLVALAGRSRRLAPDAAAPIVAALSRRGEFSKDPFVPLALWWAVERALSEGDAAATLAALDRENPLFDDVLAPRILRWAVAQDTSFGRSVVAELLQNAEDAGPLFVALNEAAAGSAERTYGEAVDRRVREAGEAAPLALRVRLGLVEPDAALAELANTTSNARRDALLGVIEDTGDAAFLPGLLDLAAAPGTPARLRSRLFTTLAGFDSPEVASRLLTARPDLDEAANAAVVELLAARPGWTAALLDAIDAGAVDPAAVSALTVQGLRRHADPALRQRLAARWPETPVDPAETEKAFAFWSRRLAVGGRGDAERGAAVYKKHCANCHTLHGVGQLVGPDLTAYQRTKRDQTLLAIVAPSAEIREGFETALLLLEDGSTLTGLLVRQTDETLELKDARGHVRTLRRADVAALEITGTSLMPNRLLDQMTDREARDLFRYLEAAPPKSEPTASAGRVR